MSTVEIRAGSQICKGSSPGYPPGISGATFFFFLRNFDGYTRVLYVRPGWAWLGHGAERRLCVRREKVTQTLGGVVSDAGTVGYSCRCGRRFGDRVNHHTHPLDNQHRTIAAASQ